MFPMRRILPFLLILALLILCTAQLFGQKGKAFKPGCPLPFNGQTGLSIDKTCGKLGSSPASNPKGQLQNSIKNNFCATGNPRILTFADFRNLQAISNMLKKQGKLTFGSDAALPTNKMREQLRFMAKGTDGKFYGEGALVMLEGFVLDARHSDTFVFGFDGESINCTLSPPCGTGLMSTKRHLQ